MRICLSLAPPPTAIPFDHINAFISAFHRWVGADNELHDAISLYSLSWLTGGQAANGGLTFPEGSTWALGFHEPDHARRVATSIASDGRLPYGFQIDTMQLLRAPADELGTEHTFFAQSPVLVRRPAGDGPPDHVRYDEADADALLTRTFRAKLRAAGLPDDAEATFTPSPHARTKLVDINGQQYRANLCPVTLRGAEAAVRFAWSAGVGGLTGCGFGFLQP